MKLLLVDPFNQATSGVTTYCHLARERLVALGWAVQIVARDDAEPIEAFRQRLAQWLEPQQGAAPAFDLIEAPETLAVTRALRDASRLHIRLHGSRHFGAWLQGLPSDPLEQAAEQREVMRARIVSAPSHAAVDTHRMHFGQVPDVRVYPNPAPPIDPASPGAPPDIDLLYLGRWQALKGIRFVEALARARPDLGVAVACQQVPAGLPRGLRHLPILTPAQRADALRRARVVLVPSLFETASMVGLEALAARRPVVAWSHLGLAEYAGPPCLHAASPWDLDDLGRKLRTALETPAICGFDAALEAINWAFDRAAEGLAGPAPPPWRPARSDRPTRDPLPLFRALPTMHSAPSTTVFQRKLRKLMRDPNAYWRDSVVRRALVGFTGHDAPAPEADTPVAVEAEPSPEGHAAALAPVHLIGTVPATGFVKLKAPAKAVAGWRVCLMHAAGAEGQAQALLEGLHAFEDFGPFRRERMNRMPFELDADEPLPSLIGRFDQKNKEALAQLDHLLLLDAPANLVSALHHCAPNLRAVVVVSAPADEGAEPAWPSADHADALVCLEGSPAAQAEGWRRKLVIPGLEQLPLALLRVIRETGPKERDMLMQILGAPSFQPGFHAFNRKRHQGLIRLRRPVPPRGPTLTAFIHALAAEVDEMYVLESVYMRYRSLVHEVEAGASPERLIASCLRDGVLFDVA